MLVGKKNTKVGVAVSVGRGVRVGVAVGVRVGGAKSCVWVAAALAVNPIAVRALFGSKVGIGAVFVGKVGTQASINKIAMRIEKIFLFLDIVLD